MARPFRFQPGASPRGVLPRPRLLAPLRQRWERRLVTVVAGPGFGKSSLLAAAMADADRPPGATDVWLSCEPADADASHLLRGLAEAIDAPGLTDVHSLCDLVWSEAPRQICLVLDDVHEVPAGSGGSSLLQRLLDDLPGNGHLLLASRAPGGVPVARLAAAGQLERVVERDLLFTSDELSDFAASHGVDPSLVASTGGWPALAELVASAGADLVLDYLWQEVLAQVGEERADLLARLALVGGGDDSVVAALAGAPITAGDLVRGVPLVMTASDGWVGLHPLWRPALDPLLSGVRRTETLRQIAELHHRAGRLDLAARLLADARSWDDLLALMREVIVEEPALLSTSELASWSRLLPAEVQTDPVALLVTGFGLQVGDPQRSVGPLREAAAGFQQRGDIDGELTAIAHEGIVRWWSADLGALLELHQRVEELAAGGSDRAVVLAAVGMAGIAHLAGDSGAVLAHLEGIDERVTPQWLPTVQWLRSVAHRRRGDLAPARRALGATSRAGNERVEDPQHAMAHLRVDWLDGRVDDVRAALPVVVAGYRQTDAHRMLAAEATLELAAKTAWLGELEMTRDLLGSVEEELGDLPLPRILRVIAEASMAVADADEPRAVELLRPVAGASLAGPERWIWRDRLAIALTHVLLPETRDMWDGDELGPPHRLGVILATALEAARAGDLAPVADVRWPSTGAVRAHLPVAWVAELAAAGAAAGNPPGADLFDSAGPALRRALRRVSHRGPPSVQKAAGRLLAALPASPGYDLRIEVLGPLAVWRDGALLDHPDLRRRRVRELLCQLVLQGTVRREAVSEDLWPDLVDAGRNLRVTLSYLQQVLQPERTGPEPPYFLRSEGSVLSLVRHDAHLTVDAWDLSAHLDRAEAAERAGRPAEALEAYCLALPLWRGEPFVDGASLGSIQGERARVTTRYLTAATRAGELLLASGRAEEAEEAAERALLADAAAEPAHRLLGRVRLSVGDRAGARRAFDRCVAALAELDLRPEAATLALFHGVDDRSPSVSSR